MFHLTLPAATHAIALLAVLSTASPLCPATPVGLQIASLPHTKTALHCRLYFGCVPVARVTNAGAE
jgi:hypothetical protein